MIEEILADLNEDIERGNIKVQKKFNPVPNIQADRDQLFRAFANIILNAIQAMPSGGQLDLVLEADKLSKFVTAKIADTGQGISKEQLKHIFDPFFTTKHYGTGLGLTISHSIIDKHRGGIDIQSESSKGTTVTVTLPVS
jgi:signal transduction histidine kinase